MVSNLSCIWVVFERREESESGFTGFAYACEQRWLRAKHYITKTTKLSKSQSWLKFDFKGSEGSSNPRNPMAGKAEKKVEFFRFPRVNDMTGELWVHCQSVCWTGEKDVSVDDVHPSTETIVDNCRQL